VKDENGTHKCLEDKNQHARRTTQVERRWKPRSWMTEERGIERANQINLFLP